MKIDDLELKWLGHSSFLIKNGKNIFIDPYKINSEEKADIILITHSHYDHCSIEDLEKISKPGTIIVVPACCQSKIARLENIEMRLVEPGDKIEIKNIKIKTIPAYNIDKQFHQKDENWLGYVLTIKNNNIYHAGDTDKIPEMANLAGFKNLIALLPVGGKFTMNAEQAAEAAFIIKPKLAIPMHYGSIIGESEDANKFIELCKSKGINAQILEK